MISDPTIIVQCDQQDPANSEQCRRSEVLSLPMPLTGSREQVRALFLATHDGWWITEGHNVYCPVCATRALNALRARKEARR